MDTRRTISHLILFGDSLSDRGTMYNRKLFGLLSFNFFAGLNGRSPEGSFANGFVWPDYLISSIANEAIVKEIKKERNVDNTDIVDAILGNDFYLKRSFKKYYDLKDDKAAKFRGTTFFRSYAEGGLTDYNYAGWPSNDVGRFFSRFILATLDQKRAKSIAYDYVNHVSQEMKDKTLILEWSGANDLITVNAKPSVSIVDRAVKKRLENAEKLIKHGYKNFIFINMPDLALTPRYQTTKIKDNGIAHNYSVYFNNELKKACDALKQKYPDIQINIFDVFDLFSQLYAEPEKYGFEKAKLTKSYVDTDDFKIQKNGASPATGYMFWNDVHPSSDVHALLGDEMLNLIGDQYKLVLPDKAHTLKRSASMSDIDRKARYQKEDQDTEILCKRARSFK